VAHQALLVVALIQYLELLRLLVVVVNHLKVVQPQMAVLVLAVGMVLPPQELEYRDKETMAVQAVAHRAIALAVVAVRVLLVATQHQQLREMVA
jgi:hypothetical protein